MGVDAEEEEVVKSVSMHFCAHWILESKDGLAPSKAGKLTPFCTATDAICEKSASNERCWSRDSAGEDFSPKVALEDNLTSSTYPKTRQAKL